MTREPHDPNAAALGLSEVERASSPSPALALGHAQRIEITQLVDKIHSQIGHCPPDVQRLALDAIPAAVKQVLALSAANAGAVEVSGLTPCFCGRCRSARLTFEQVSCINARRCHMSFHDVGAWSPNDWATALAGETGELCNLLKKRRRGEAIPDQAIADEMADVFLYLDLLATRLGIDLASAVIRKFNAVSVKVGSEERL